jgi:arginine/lysine/ornithine decarboxylase
LLERKYKLDLREVLSGETELLPANECIGRVSAEIRYKCPPGFPVLVYGEEILAQHAELFGKEKIRVLRND